MRRKEKPIQPLITTAKNLTIQANTFASKIPKEQLRITLPSNTTLTLDSSFSKRIQRKHTFQIENTLAPVMLTLQTLTLGQRQYNHSPLSQFTKTQKTHAAP
jgi:hypothetical protein